MTKMVGAAEFKAKCLKLIDEMQHDGEPVTITKRGKPVATLSVAKPEKPKPLSILGALAHPTYRFDDPFSPAVDPDDCRWPYRLRRGRLCRPGAGPGADQPGLVAGPPVRWLSAPAPSSGS